MTAADYLLAVSSRHVLSYIDVQGSDIMLNTCAVSIYNKPLQCTDKYLIYYILYRIHT